MILPLLIGALAAAVTSVAALSVILPWLRRLQVVDIPVERSLHTLPVVRGAGLALLPGLVVGVTVAEVLLDRSGSVDVTFSSTLYVVLATVVTLAFAGIGLSDDFFAHGVASRLLMQGAVGVLAATAIISALGASAVWILPVAVGLVATVNITNFMDGANGLLIFHGLVTATWLSALAANYGMAGVSGFAAAAAGTLLAVLPVNVRGRAFLGDVGSYAVGAVWGVLCAMLLIAGVPAEAALAPVVVFVADFAYTLQLRVRAGDRWYQPHKLHVYQRLISGGWPHLASSGLVAAVTMVLCLLSLPALLGAPTVVRVVSVLLGLALVVGYLRLPVVIGAPVPWHRPRSRSAVRGQV